MRIALLIGVAVTLVTATILRVRHRRAGLMSNDWLDAQERRDERAGWTDGVPWRQPVAAETREGFARIRQREWKRGE